MSFNLMQKNTLDLSEFEQLIKGPYPNMRADLIIKYIGNFLLIYKGSLYVMKENKTFQKSTIDIKNQIITFASKFIEISYKNLSKTDRKYIKSNYEKTYKTVFSNNHILTYYQQLSTNLEKGDIKFNITLSEIHYNNGYLDLNDLQFKQREINKHYITQYIKRDYIPSTTKQQNKVLSYIKKIYSQPEDLEVILLTLGSALTGKSVLEQDTLFLLGKGSSGKSFLLSLTKLAIEIYFKELQSDMFSTGNSKSDKILNTFAESPQIRITWINEIKDVKIDASALKKFVDGDLQATKLFKDGSDDFKHYSKAIFTANTMPNINIDTGINRRFRAYTHKSDFTRNKDLVDEKNNVFMANIHLLDEIVENNLLDAWIDILSKKGNEWLKGTKIILTENFIDTNSTIMDSNDIFKDFIDKNIVITNDDKDRIGKNQMHLKFNQMFPNKHLTVLQIINSLKEKDINYSCKFRHDSIQGCFYNVKFKDDFIDDNETDEEDHLESYYQNKCVDLEKKIKELTLKLNNLQLTKSS